MPSGQGPTTGHGATVSRLIATASHEALGPWARMAAPESGRCRVARNDGSIPVSRSARGGASPGPYPRPSPTSAQPAAELPHWLHRSRISRSGAAEARPLNQRRPAGMHGDDEIVPSTAAALARPRTALRSVRSQTPTCGAPAATAERTLEPGAHRYGRVLRIAELDRRGVLWLRQAVFPAAIPGMPSRCCA